MVNNNQMNINNNNQMNMVNNNQMNINNNNNQMNLNVMNNIGMQNQNLNISPEDFNQFLDSTTSKLFRYAFCKTDISPQSDQTLSKSID